MLVKKEGFEFICSLDQYELHQFVLQSLTDYYGEKDIISTKDYLYASGGSVMFVAHFDTVHRSKVTDFWYNADCSKVMALEGIGGDDRCGIYTLLSLIKYTKVKPTVLFTHEEERGCIGARAFVENEQKELLKHVKFIVEIDRKGKNDAVFYSCGNKEFKEMILEKTGYIEQRGSSSDIAHLSPYFDLASVNLSSGYYNPHNNNEYVVFEELGNTIDKCFELYEYGMSDECKRYEYSEAKPTTYTSSGYYYGNYFSQDDRYSNFSKKDKKEKHEVKDISNKNIKVDVSDTHKIVKEVIEKYKNMSYDELSKNIEKYKKQFLNK